MKNEPKNYPDHPDRFDHWQQVSIYCLLDVILCLKTGKGVNIYGDKMMKKEEA